ncbi:MAG: serine hydrolase domain-containing protein [Devosia sp.]
MDISGRLNAAVDAALGSRIVGCVVLVEQHGKRIFSRAAGLADREAKIPVVENTIFRLASCTKPIVATAVLVMADKGLLSLDDPVTRFLPYITPKGPDGTTPTITLRQLLSHSSGISYMSPAPDVSRGLGPDPIITLEENMRRLGHSELAFMPGTAWEYGMSIDVLAAVIAAINGDVNDVEGALRKYVTGPLGMDDTHFYVDDPSRLSPAYADAKPVPLRMAEPQEVRDPDDPNRVEIFSPQRIFNRAVPQSGGAGMAGSAGDFMKLLEAWRARKLLRPETVSAACSNQIGGLDRPLDPGQKFGFVGAVIEDAKASGWPKKGMVHWGGIWGNNRIVDPETETNVVVMTNTMREGCNGPFREEIRDAVFP